MNVCAVISEFNPFHDGHKHLIQSAKQMGFTHIIAIMSGNFVQRGEPAIYTKRFRTQIALENGVDLIVEMPCVWSLSSAEKYAETGVCLASALGCVNALVFGSECGNLQTLNSIKNIMASDNFNSILHDYMNKGVTFAKARELSLAKISNNVDIAQIITKPNNVLGIEYLRAIDKLNSKIIPITIPRNSSFQSASEIREIIKNQDYDYSTRIPKTCFNAKELPKDLFYGEKAIVAKLQTMALDDICKLPHISEGLEHKIYNSLQKCGDLEELLGLVKSKRYIMARIKRIILCAYLGVSKYLQMQNPPYLRILGATKNGLEVLQKCKFSSNLPIVTKFSDFKKLDDFSKKIFDIERQSTKLAGVFSKKLRVLPPEESFKFVRCDNHGL